jgi:hypothetical protein
VFYFSKKVFSVISEATIAPIVTKFPVLQYAPDAVSENVSVALSKSRRKMRFGVPDGGR